MLYSILQTNKRHIFLWLLIVGLITLVGRTYIGHEFPYTHDGENHLARFANYTMAVKEGQLPPRFAPNLQNRYGYPVFNYNYPLANMLAAPFGIVRIEYELIFKLQVFAALTIAAAGAWSLASHHSKSLHVRALATSLYMLAPIAARTLTYRGNIGETWAFALLPWALYCVYRVRDGVVHSALETVMLTLVIAGFLLSHNILAVFGVLFVVCIACIEFGLSFEKYGAMAKYAVPAALLAVWFWVPALLETHLVVLPDVSQNNNAAGHALSIDQLLFAKEAFGLSFDGSIDSFPTSLGIASLVALVISGVYAAVYKKNTKTKYYFFVALLVIAAQTVYLQDIWQLPVIQYIQFPWRLQFIAAPALVLSILPALSVSRVQKIMAVALVLQAAHLTAMSPYAYFNKTNADYELFPQSTTTQLENTPRTFTYHTVADWQPSPSAIDGEATFSTIFWRGSKRSYRVDSVRGAEVTIVEPTMYFPGWQSYVVNDLGERKKLTYKDSKEIGGRIAYTLNYPTDTERDASLRVETRFYQETPVRLWANATSFITAIWIIGNFVQSVRKKAA